MRRFPDSVALKVVGRSMEPTLHHGDIVLVAPLESVRSGDVVVAYYRSLPDGGLICGEWRRPRGKAWWLYKHNVEDPSYPRVNIGTVPCLRILIGRIVVIVETNHDASDLPLMCCRPLGRKARALAAATSDEITLRSRHAASEFHARIALVDDSWNRGASCIQVVKTNKRAPL
jgi:hypothetical protein